MPFPAHNVGDHGTADLQHSAHVVGRRHIAPTNEYRARFYRHEYPHGIAGELKGPGFSGLVR